MSTAAVAEAEPTDAPIDEITSLDDLRRLASVVQSTNRRRLVSIASGGQITLAPTPKKRRRLTPEEKALADEKAFLSSAGALKGAFDYDEFMQQVRAGRSFKRPPVIFDEPGG